MAIKNLSLKSAVARLVAMAPEREIYLRTGGSVRFLRISTRVQLGLAFLAILLLGGWGIATGSMLWTQAHLSVERAALDQQRAAVVKRQAKVDAYRSEVSEIADDLEQRQEALEDMLESGLGLEPAKAAPAAPADVANPRAKPASGKISALSPEEARLRQLHVQQRAFEGRVAEAVKARLARVEKAIRSFGLNPATMRKARSAQGGPFVPVRGLIASDPDLRDLAALVGRLNDLESTLAAIPSGRPTAARMQTSSYGYRRDPFNGLPAFHAGIDFPGSYGQEITAAAAGRVSFVGRRSGYGNVVEIDHGNGIVTRYAHLSRFGTKVGAKVTRGEAIARMGSTGRSTGTHLHFEVRVRGAAVNPRRFLEARQDVLEVQQLAKQRISGGKRG